MFTRPRTTNISPTRTTRLALNIVHLLATLRSPPIEASTSLTRLFPRVPRPQLGMYPPLYPPQMLIQALFPLLPRATLQHTLLDMAASVSVP